MFRVHLQLKLQLNVLRSKLGKIEKEMTDMIPFALDVNTYEPPRGKTNNVVSEQVRQKSGCTVTEKS